MTEREMAEALMRQLDTLLTGGLTLPLYVAAMATNGAMAAGMLFEGGDDTIVCDVWWTRELSSLNGPVSATYLDQTGRAACLVVDPYAHQPEDEPAP